MDRKNLTTENINLKPGVENMKKAVVLKLQLPVH